MDNTLPFEKIEAARRAFEATPPACRDRTIALMALQIQAVNTLSKWPTVDNSDENNAQARVELFDWNRRATAHLQEVIKLTREYLSILPEDIPDRAAVLSNLAVLLGRRFGITRADADLDEAIRLCREAVDATSQDDPKRIARLNNLANRLGDQYLRSGLIEDIDQAIEIASEVASGTPKTDPSRTGRMKNLARHRFYRYLNTRMISDLDDAIQIARDLVEFATKNAPDNLLDYWNHLAVFLTHRYTRTPDPTTIEESIKILQKALTTDPGTAATLGNLGNAFLYKYNETESADDLEESVQAFQEAEKHIVHADLFYAGLLNNMSVAFGRRYSLKQAPSDLDDAIRCARESVELTPQQYPEWGSSHRNLGDHLYERYQSTKTPRDLEESIASHRIALFNAQVPIITRISAGEAAIRSCASASDWQQAYEIATTSLDLIPKLSPRSLENLDRQSMMSLFTGLASTGAATAINAGKGAFAALSLLEQGRGVVASFLEEMRADVQDLHDKYPDLAEKFEKLRDELDVPTGRTDSITLHEIEIPSRGDSRHNASNDLDEIITEIRDKPGFDNFLSAPTEEQIQGAAEFGPIVVINVSEHRCDAILVQQREIHSLHLTNLHSQDVEIMAEKHNLGSSEVLEWLWDAAAYPILDALGFSKQSSDAWPHVWWIPTGPLTRFPLHAAGYHDAHSCNTVIDRVMSSYGLSIKAIISTRQRHSEEALDLVSNQALLVAMEHTPGYSDLPFVAEEVVTISDICRGMAIAPVEPKRRKEVVLSHLPACKLFHFAGHGHTDRSDPSKSNLLLEDCTSDRLTVGNLLEINLHRSSPFLAYLSACGTGKIIDESFLDEGIHLISGFQLAGFRHVIGTLWEVNDRYCVDAARVTYETMRDEGLKDESVCRGLHKAMRELRDRWNNLPPDARGQRRDAETADLTLAKCEEDIIGAEMNVNQKGKYGIHGPRDVVIDDDERPPPWIPYVHYGG